MGYTEFYALTDTATSMSAARRPRSAFFDGDPFPADNQLPDGEPTLHDRALAMMRVAMVDLDRLHIDPGDRASRRRRRDDRRDPDPRHTMPTTTVAYTILGLRTVLRSLGSRLELYSNNMPDTVVARRRSFAGRSLSRAMRR